MTIMQQAFLKAIATYNNSIDDPEYAIWLDGNGYTPHSLIFAWALPF